jgi:hypothetical protein
VPTCVEVRCESERSQHVNREMALAVLRARLLARERAATDSARAHERRQQIGSGQRGDKRRTIRAQDGNVTDHVAGRTWQYKRYVRGDRDCRAEYPVDARTLTVGTPLARSRFVATMRTFIVAMVLCGAVQIVAADGHDEPPLICQGDGVSYRFVGQGSFELKKESVGGHKAKVTLVVKRDGTDVASHSLYDSFPWTVNVGNGNYALFVYQQDGASTPAGLAGTNCTSGKFSHALFSSTNGFSLDLRVER